MSWLNPNRWDDLVSRRDAARTLRDVADRNRHPHQDDEPKPPWYRNMWVWVSIVMCVLVLAWLVAVFT
jgi:hypothetical protein